MKIKVCGMREPGNIREIGQLPINWMGFIFYPASPRYAGNLSPKDLQELPSQIRKVGVFVNESLPVIRETILKYALDTVQLHGNEAPFFCETLRNEGVEVIKAFSLMAVEDLQQCIAYRDTCNYYVFDTKTPLYGGSGKQYDWQILSAYRDSTPFLLSGGIGPQDSERIRTFAHPMLTGIDLNSRFEQQPGQKDIATIKTLLKNIQHGNK